MNFTEFNLNAPLLNALNNLGYHTATTIQQKVFNIVKSGKDVCGIAQTGTGKTMAYLLPCISQWSFNKAKDPQILILVPTRELVTQLVDVIHSLTTYMSLTAVGVYGGVNINTQKLSLENGADILVATPGRLYDLAIGGAFKTKSIRKLIIDEVDEMLNLGFRTQLKNIMEIIPQRRQNLMFSATITEYVEDLMNAYFNAPVMVEAAPTGTPLENISQTVYAVPNFNTKLHLLAHLLSDKETFSKVLVFAATKKLADLAFAAMDNLYPGTVGVIHSNKEQNHRFNTVVQFKNGNYRFIISTDIVARGIDVAEVSHVINIDTTDTPENYIHRIGRTGRADKKGVAITFYTEKEEPLLENIETLMNYKIPVVALPDEVEISTVLIDDEIEKVYVKEISIKLPKRENVGAAFHQKSAKNSRTNVRITKKQAMHAKYGKPISRGAKKK
jgi:ATP-dependent RNA helicase RhlE